ncbi:hypothetical protein [Agreia sp. VKM Ac-1783]|uniref:hypothetical protein n=1 Tax=Agreia sp. VKM Ac-1783 TaxID=1938889 RepID=UPI000A2AE890|nr:hypothetical protein [Agreia sp. VKM Ac-1783]SMQ61688.1 hypothetical protein SAMN06295943_0657 [Agreia sp. VKM Ac-1783]
MNHPTRVNPFEIALWALAVVLTVGGGAALAWSVSRLGTGGGPYSDGFVATQMIFSLAPVAVTAGLFSLVAALAFRAALLVVARRAAASAREARLAEASSTSATTATTATGEIPRAASPTGVAPEEASVTSEQPRFRQRQRALDHSAFKRPGTE